MCAGKSKRFNTYKPKCLALINGVPNLELTINKLNSLGHTNIDVTYPTDRRYYFDSIEDRVNLIPGFNKYESQRFSNAFPLEEETVYLYGDVIYHINDLELILQPIQTITWYGRIGSNPNTKSNDELMGVRVIDTKKFEWAVNETRRQFRSKERKQEIGWDIYEVHEGLKRRTPSNFTQLSDLTDDYDTQHQLTKLLKLNEQRT